MVVSGFTADTKPCRIVFGGLLSATTTEMPMRAAAMIADLRRTAAKTGDC